MTDARQAYRLTAGVEYLDVLRIRLQLIVLLPRAAHAEVVVAFLPDFHKIVIRGDASVETDKHPLLWRDGHAASRGKRDDHGGQGVWVGRIASQDA